VKAFRRFAGGGVSALNPTTVAGLVIAMGKCLSVVVYAQLIAENCLAAEASPSAVAVIFHGLIEDLSTEAIKLSAMFPPGSPQRVLLRKVIRVPNTSAADLGSVADFITAPGNPFDSLDANR